MTYDTVIVDSHVILPTGKVDITKRKIMDDSEIAKRDHQRNKSEIVKLVKEMFSQEKWGDEEYKKKLLKLLGLI